MRVPKKMRVDPEPAPALEKKEGAKKMRVGRRQPREQEVRTWGEEGRGGGPGISAVLVRP